MDDDGALLLAWRAGDRSAGKLLFERYFDSIARFFRSKLDGGYDDLVQDVFKGCLAGRERLREATSFRAYLFSIAHNVLRSHFRARQKYKDNYDFGAEHSLLDLVPGVTTMQGEAEEQRALLEALRRLPLNSQLILELRYWESMTTAEIAEVLQVPHPTARSRLRRALELLAAELVRLGQSPTRLRTTLDYLDAWAERLRAPPQD